MPFLRVLRDKRGYETTYLMHWFREGRNQRSRILYVFRTPPGVRVGREALDADIAHELESRYPDIEFDWSALLDNQQLVDAAAEPRRPRKRRREGPEEPAAVAPAARPAETPATAAPRFQIPAGIDGETREARIAFLSIWYPQIRERVPHRTQDPVRREALLALAERLNPAAWGDDEPKIDAGLADASQAWLRLARIFSARRRRSRRGRRPVSDDGAPAPAAESPKPPDSE